VGRGKKSDQRSTRGGIDLVEEREDVLKGGTRVGIFNATLLQDMCNGSGQSVGRREMLFAIEKLRNIRTIEACVRLGLCEELPEEDSKLIDVALER